MINTDLTLTPQPVPLGMLRLGPTCEPGHIQYTHSRVSSSVKFLDSNEYCVI